MPITNGSDYNAHTTPGYNSEGSVIAGAGTQPLFAPVLNRYVLSVAKPNLVFAQFSQKAKITKGKGKMVAWDKYEPLPLAKTPLTEGVVPAGSQIDVKRITAEPHQYGNYVSTTDEFDFYKYDPSPEVLRIGEILADNAAETFDSLTCDAIGSFGLMQYAGGKDSIESISAGDVITLADIKKAVRTLKKNKARKFDGKHFICILDPETAHDLTNDELWKNVKMRDPKDLYEGEIGELFGVRFIETTETEYEVLKDHNTTDGGERIANPVHAVYVFGQDAYGTVDVKENVETVTHGKHEIGGPLDQFSTMGWKGHHLAKVLTPEWLVEINCGVSA